MPHSFFWYDVMTTDTKAAQIFYCDVVGWTAEDTGPKGNGYILFNTQGQGVAGLMTIPEETAKHGARPAWTGYIAVDDVDEAANRLKQEGGQVVRGPIDVPGIIRFAVVVDPQGAAFMIAKATPPQNAPSPLPIGTQGAELLDAKVGDGDTGSTFASAARVLLAEIDRLRAAPPNWQRGLWRICPMTYPSTRLRRVPV